MSATTLGIKVDAALRERIRNAAARIGRTQHWLIKQSIFAFLEDIEAGRLPASLVHLAESDSDELKSLEELGLIAASSQAAQPFLEFAQSVAPQSVLRAAITSAYRRAEPECLPMLINLAQQPEQQSAIQELAHKLVLALRSKRLGSGVEGLIHEYSLSSQEGIALMCLAEALLRIPDRATRDALIRDKISQGDWQSHLSSGSLFVNAATWGLMLTGKLVATNSEKGMSNALTRLISKGGEPLIRQAVDRAMRLMGEHFVCGETINKALANSQPWIGKGFNYSYDMLGEAAMTMADAERYYHSYEQAIHAIGKSAAKEGIYQGPGISIKLSALHPRYSRAQQGRVFRELYPRLRALTLLAREYDIGLNIDAEEADRLELSLDLLEQLCHEPALAGWNGIGFVVQAYQKRAPYVLDYLIDLARRSQHRLMVRLVKGAYWDSEIKRAQVDGLEGYPVYTRKVHTDVAYLACARKLLAAPDAIFPQFATHNAQTVAAIYHMAGANYYAGQYEFQCLHGMGEPLYEEVVGSIKAGKLARPCRIYAPVGSHKTLLAYLVRRLLENGANSSFVHQIADERFPIEQLIADPVAASLEVEPIGAPHPLLPLPVDLYRAQGQPRKNSSGLDLSNEQRLASLSVGLLNSTSLDWRAEPSSFTGDEAQFDARALAIHNPANHQDVVGHVVTAEPAEVEQALQQAVHAAPVWSATPAAERAHYLRRAADILEADLPNLIALAVREAGKSYANAIAEVREAVDFLRYYANEVAESFEADSHRPLGVVVCISPWNFPLAIFLGQISAALAAGNVVLAKPAGQTPLIAARGLAALHQAGVPREAVQLLPGGGEVGAQLVADVRVNGVMFTGSTGVAQNIAHTLAQRLNPDGQVVPLIAETGGLNAMVVDSSALPEQVVADVIHSAFDSAGQRCSALRILCIQEDVADELITMLQGALQVLRLGNPDRLDTDVGPVIDRAAQQRIEAHIQRMREQGFDVVQLTKTTDSHLGTFVPPTLIFINHVSDVQHEVFGPVLHVLRYPRAQLNALMEAINASGYGLTFGVHSRIDESIDQVLGQAQVGNLYVNRNIVGAIVGVQPFGGQGLSGTGPKAGGPLYLPRLLMQRPSVLALRQRNPERKASPLQSEALAWLTAAQPQFAQTLEVQSPHSLYGVRETLPGPTGESNVYEVQPRQTVLCVVQSSLGLAVQLASCVLADTPHIMVVEVGQGSAFADLPTVPAALEARLQRVASVEDALSQSKQIGAVLFEGDGDQLLALSQILAAYPYAVLQPQGLSYSELVQGQWYRLERLFVERSISINTAAAGGNATLMAMI